MGSQFQITNSPPGLGRRGNLGQSVFIAQQLSKPGMVMNVTQMVQVCCISLRGPDNNLVLIVTDRNLAPSLIILGFQHRHD